MIDFKNDNFLLFLSKCKCLLDSINECDLDNSVFPVDTLVWHYVKEHGFSEAEAREEIFEVLRKLC